MIVVIKSIHTLVWLMMTTAVWYIGYSVFRMEFDVLFYVSLTMIGVESMVIIFNSWKCPLTDVARKYSDDDEPNFDIYLPRIVAKFNKEIFSIILFVILLMYVYNVAM